MQQKDLLYAGKAKSLFTTSESDVLIAHFRDDTSAFDGVKTEKLSHKGAVNNQFNAFIMQHLEHSGVKTHFLEVLNSTDSLVTKLDMLPIECVIRNRAAGSLCKRLGVKHGLQLSPPLFEFFLKNDELHDPMITAEHIVAFSWAKESEIAELKQLSLAVNACLLPLFAKAGMILVDFKLEFGRNADGKLILADEFTPDGCRVWDIDTNESLDKDRFRQDLGDVVESYQIVAKKLGAPISI